MFLGPAAELTKHYEELAPYYDGIAEAGYYDYEGFLEKIRPLISGSSVLEIGAGTGNLTRRLIESGFRVVGIDCSEPMLAIARTKLSEFSVELICSSITSFRRPCVFDAAISYAATFVRVQSADGDVIETYLADQRQVARALTNIAASVKSNGLYAFDTYPEHDPNSRFFEFGELRYEFEIEQLRGMWEFEKHHFIRRDGATIAHSRVRKSRIPEAEFRQTALSNGFQEVAVREGIVRLLK